MTEAATAMQEEQQKERKDEQFHDFLKELIALPQYTMAEYRENLDISLQRQEDGMTWLMRRRLNLDTLRGGQNEKMLEAQKEKVRQQIAVVKQMTACEVDRPALVQYRERERIAKART